MTPVTLAIESSCDDTSVSLVTGEGKVVGLINQDQEVFHQRFGGVIPEIASRKHTETLVPLVDTLLSEFLTDQHQVQFISVTNRPGLIGALMTGVVVAKTLAWKWRVPIVPVNHLHAHIAAPFLEGQNPLYPFLCLAASGGHTSLYLVSGPQQFFVVGTTRDDAAGEALDKFAKRVGLPFPGGSAIDKLAQSGDPHAFSFPFPMAHQNTLDMSFSGLKASADRLIASLSEDRIAEALPDLCASFQNAVISSLVMKLEKACELFHPKLVAVTGGVSANSLLRLRAQSLCNSLGIPLVLPELKFTTDNAAMVGWQGWLSFERSHQPFCGVRPYAKSLAEDFQLLNDPLDWQKLGRTS